MSTPRVLCYGLLALTALLAGSFTGSGANAQTLALELVDTGFTRPLFFAAANDGSDRHFIVQQNGQILVKGPTDESWSAYLNIESRVLSTGNEQGLLGLAFHPDFASNGFFYVNYTYTRPGGSSTRISRFQATEPYDQSNSVDANTEFTILEFAQTAANHNGGFIGFGPNDGYLYIASGDGGSSNDPNNAGQLRNTLLGKILRIDVSTGPPEDPPYLIPPTNPFPSVLGVEPEIWAYGLRNPYRCSFDRATGDFYIADVGQNAREEINFQAAASSGGENYGWRIFEGTRCNTPTVTEEICDDEADNMVFPIHEYDNPDEGRSVTGGYVYRGASLNGFQGRYFFADFLAARVWSLRVVDGAATDLQEHTSDLNANGINLQNLASFGEDEQGELYLVSLGGPLYRFVLADTGEGEGPVEGIHTADQNGDNIISLSELLRVIQFFNSSGYQCAEGTEDGYAPGLGDENCTPHDSDYNPQNWMISLSELLRLIQFFNSPGYIACPDALTEDGYCVADA